MEYIYSCEKYDSRNKCIGYLIADESEFISSPPYLHSFKNRMSNKNYCVISDNIGIPMPYLSLDSKLIIGTSQFIYFFDAIFEHIEYILLSSPCTVIEKFYKIIIVICECDVTFISLSDVHIIATFAFDDVITDYSISSESMYIYLMEKGEKKLDITPYYLRG